MDRLNRLATLILAAACLIAGGAVSIAEEGDGTFGSSERFLPKDGSVLYRSICQGCHMPDAKGAVGAGRYPALAHNAKLENASYPIFMVVSGFKAMPSFAMYLDNEQVAAVVNYVRTHFGNAYADEVSPTAVKIIRDGQCRPDRNNLSYTRSAAFGTALPTRARCSP
jgi:mono/diheme cytochrome c family protein